MTKAKGGEGGGAVASGGKPRKASRSLVGAETLQRRPSAEFSLRLLTDDGELSVATTVSWFPLHTVLIFELAAFPPSAFNTPQKSDSGAKPSDDIP